MGKDPEVHCTAATALIFPDACITWEQLDETSRPTSSFPTETSESNTTLPIQLGVLNSLPCRLHPAGPAVYKTPQTTDELEISSV